MKKLKKMQLFQTLPYRSCFALIWVLLLLGCSNQKDSVIISLNSEDPGILFAMDELELVFYEKGQKILTIKSDDADIVIDIKSDNEGLQSEGFSIIKDGDRIKVIGFDAAGAMYGCLELAEQIRLYGLNGVKETTQNPYMELRGTKFNIPLDVRTPSYSCAGDASQVNIPEMWSFDFWKEYIDNLARYRFNLISIWSLHPFPSMVKVPDYPDVALNDVQRTTLDISVLSGYYRNVGVGLDAPEILANTEVLMKISIEEKIEFWRKVMRYAKERNIDFCVVTWNIFVNGTDGKYGITDDIDNEITRDYFRKSVRQMFVTYPDLAGIGLTTGENMGFQMPVEEKEEWAYETYGQGILDIANESPDRKFTFIHRLHQANIEIITRKFNPVIDNKNIEFLYSFKYAQAHVYSAIEQPFHERIIKEIEEPKSIIWTIRNDDVYYFRWGSPDFVREFIKNVPYHVSRGFYYGSDGWIWGRDFLTKEPENQHQLEIVKHWYHWMIWGRLGYDPNLSNERFIQILQNRFPEVEAERLFTAWQEASMIYPVTTGFHWGQFDFQWYIEGCLSQPGPAQTETGFHDVNRFITLPPHPRSGYQSIPDFVAMKVNNGTTELLNPFEVADKLHAHSDKAINILETLHGGDNKELEITLHDIKTISYLGKYYACKIAGATNLALYRETKESKFQDEAVNQLVQGLDYWKKYTESATQKYINPVWLNRVRKVDWEKFTEYAEQDIDIAKASLE